MNQHFLLIYHRRTGTLSSVESYTGDGAARRALQARFSAEESSSDPDVEIVVLEAQSEQALRTTHSRYFRDLGQLAGDLRDTFTQRELIERTV